MSNQLNLYDMRISEPLGAYLSKQPVSLLDYSKELTNKKLSRIPYYPTVITEGCKNKVELLKLLKLIYKNSPGISFIDISKCGINRAIMTYLNRFTKLTYLNISYNKFNSNIATELGKLINLTGLDISGYDVTDLYSYFIPNLKNLEILSITSEGMESSQIKYLKDLKKLKRLNLIRVIDWIDVYNEDEDEELIVDTIVGKISRYELMFKKLKRELPNVNIFKSNFFKNWEELNNDLLWTLSSVDYSRTSRMAYLNENNDYEIYKNMLDTGHNPQVGLDGYINALISGSRYFNDYVEFGQGSYKRILNMFLKNKNVKLNINRLFNRDESLEGEESYEDEINGYGVRGKLIDTLNELGYLSKKDVNKYCNWKKIEPGYWEEIDEMDIDYDLKRFMYLKDCSEFLKSI